MKHDVFSPHQVIQKAFSALSARGRSVQQTSETAAADSLIQHLDHIIHT